MAALSRRGCGVSRVIVWLAVVVDEVPDERPGALGARALGALATAAVTETPEAFGERVESRPWDEDEGGGA